jgi:hypothetical protein
MGESHALAARRFGVSQFRCETWLAAWKSAVRRAEAGEMTLAFSAAELLLRVTDLFEDMIDAKA